MRSTSVGARIAIAVLVVALIALSVIAYGSYRRTRELERSLAQQRQDIDELEDGADQSHPEDAFEDLAKDLEGLLGDQGLGDTSDLFGSGNTDLLKCLDTGSASDLFGGGSSDDIGDLFGGSPEPDKEPPPQKLVRQISAQISKLRGLDYDDEVDAQFLSSRRLEGRISKLFLEDYSRADAERERRVLAALGALPADYDLFDMRKSVLEGQVAGFYVPESNELVVRTSSGGIGALEKTTLAHELEHALADQNFELPLSEDRDPSEADEDLATLALIEGDATLTMQQFSLSFLSLEDQLSMLSGSADLLTAQRQLEAMPHYLQQELTFPYLDGMNFVCDLFAEGGWGAVDRVYDHHPASSDQILFTERYTASEDPSDVRDPGDPGGTWDEALDTTIGAAELKWLFEAPGDDTGLALADPLEAVRAWGGGELKLFTDGDASAVGIALLQHSGEEGLCDSVTQWYEAAFEDDRQAATTGDEVLVTAGESQDAVVSCAGEEVRVGIAPDLDAARALVD